MASNIPIIVHGNSFSLAIPLQIYYINGDQMDLEDYTPDPTDEVSVQLKGSRRNYTYTPTIDGNVANIDLSGNELADNYSVVVSIVKANGQRLRSFRTDQFFIVESSDDLTTDDIIQGLEENVIYLNSSIFVAGEDGRGIESITKTGASGLVDTYTITYTDATTSTFNVTNGANGQAGAQGVGITSIEKTGTSGLVDTYTITLSNGETSTFEVTNGKDGYDMGLAAIVNDLTTGGTTDALSAEMGKELGVRTTSRQVIPCWAICTLGGYWKANGELAPNATNSYKYALIDIRNVSHLNIGSDALSNRVVYFGSDGETFLGTTTAADVAASSFPSGSVYAGFSYAKDSTSNVTINYTNSKVVNEVDEGEFTYKKMTIKGGHWYLVYNTGVQQYSSQWWGVQGFIPLRGATNIYSPQFEVGNSGCWCFYDENLAFIEGKTIKPGCPIPATAKYAKLMTGKTVSATIDVYLWQGNVDILTHLYGIERSLLALQPRPLQGKKVAFLGDSITDANATTYSGGIFVKVFEENTGCIVENFAVAGRTYANNNIGSEADNLVGDEDIVVMMGGTNDFGTSKPIGDIYEESGGNIVPTSNLSTMCGGLHSAIQAIYTKCPTAQVVIITPPQKGNGWTANTQSKYLYEYVDAIKKIAQLYGIPVVDQFANSGINPMFDAMKAKYYKSDGTHPAGTYHQLLANWLYAVIAPWVKEPFL